MTQRENMEREVKVSEDHVWVGVEEQRFIWATNFVQSELGTVISVEF
jgi:glycine cleavage system H lipoate-binding protein